MQYEKLKQPHFVVDLFEGAERITIQSSRLIFMTAFMIVWFCGWTFVGVSTIAKLFQSPNLFVAFWLFGWAIGEAYVALYLGWIFTGSEELSVVDGDLRIVYRLFGYSIRKLYRGGDIRDLAANPIIRNARYEQATLSFLSWNRVGCIHFAYGARTTYVGADLDIVEAQFIADRLLKRLPQSAISHPS